MNKAFRPKHGLIEKAQYIEATKVLDEMVRDFQRRERAIKRGLKETTTGPIIIRRGL